MKLGILTYHCSYNFGANLQVLALQSVLRKKGVDCVVVNYRDPAKMQWYARTTLPEQAALHEAFLAKYLSLGPVLTAPNEVEDYCHSALDAVFVGSDAVFRLPSKYSPRELARSLLGRTQGFSPGEADTLSPYWLNWSRNGRGSRIGRACIAASAEGSTYYHANPRLFPSLYRCLRSFQLISVRDRWTASMVRMLTLGTREAAICPDPVFALNSAFAIPPEEKPPQEVAGCILLSGEFGPGWTARFADAAHRRGYKIANLPNPDRAFHFPEADIAIDLPLTPLQWYGLLANAAGFIGIRFHALVSCLTNQTPAVALDRSAKLQFNYRARSKVYDLCQRAQIPERYSTTKRILAAPPERLLETLEDKSRQQKADNYALTAEQSFSRMIDQALHAVSMPAASA